MLDFTHVDLESADKDADKSKSVSAAAHELHTTHIRARHEVRPLAGPVGAARHSEATSFHCLLTRHVRMSPVTCGATSGCERCRPILRQWSG